MYKLWISVTGLAMIAFIQFASADSKGIGATINFNQNVEDLEIEVKPDLSRSYDRVFSIQARGTSGAEMSVRFNIGDSWFFDSDEISPWVPISKAQVDMMPDGLRSRILNKQRLESYQVLHLLNKYLVQNMDESIHIGEHVFKRSETAFVSKKRGSDNSSPERILEFVIAAIKNRDHLMIETVYGDLNTGATGRFSGFSKAFLETLSGKAFRAERLQQETAREYWNDYALSAMKEDPGFCAREETYQAALIMEDEQKSLNARIHCFSSQSHRKYTSCGDSGPFSNRECSIELK